MSNTNNQSNNEKIESNGYILFLSIAEQINQASKGIKQAIKLAKETNRTFVIPYVSSSKVRPPSYDGGKLLSLSSYFDMDHIRKEYYPHIIEFHEFLEQGSGIPIRPFGLDHLRIPKNALKKISKRTISRVFRNENHIIREPIVYSFPKSKESSFYDVINIINQHKHETIAFAPFDRYLWNEGGVPEFMPSKFLKYEVERFKQANGLNDGYIAIQWRFERTLPSESNRILELIIQNVNDYVRTRSNIKILLGTDLDFKYGSSTLDRREYETFKPIQDELIRRLPFEPIIYNPSLSPFENYLDRGMVGIIEQELFIGADLFIPAMVRSGFVKTILRKRHAERKESRLLLEKDRRIWEKDMLFYHKNGIIIGYKH